CLPGTLVTATRRSPRTRCKTSSTVSASSKSSAKRLTMPPPNQNPNVAQLRQVRQQRRAGGQARPQSSPHLAVSLKDFFAYMVIHNYIYAPTGDLWPAASVNARITPIVLRDNHGNPVLDPDGNPVKVKAAAWLDHNKPVEQMTWAPGEPAVVSDRLITEG